VSEDRRAQCPLRRTSATRSRQRAADAGRSLARRRAPREARADLPQCPLRPASVTPSRRRAADARWSSPERKPWWAGPGADDADVGASEYRVERGGELAVPVADQELEPVGAVAEVHEQVAGLLGDPGSGGVGGDPGEVHAAAAVLDHEQDVKAVQEDGVDVGEVDGDDRAGLRGEELSPGRAGPPWSGIEARALQDLPDRRGGDLVAESDELALDASVAPGGVLTGHPQHEGLNRRGSGWAARLSRVGPVASDDAGVPAQQRSGRHQPQLA
jgi:hypothetical protein